MLQRRISSAGMAAVCRAFAEFRPSIVTHLRSLNEDDFILMEKSFQRTVIEMDRLLPLTGAPHCVWRRTGEISGVTAEFSYLSGWPQGSLSDGRRTIFEILDESSIVSYWEQYAQCIRDRSLANFRIVGSILKPDGRQIHGVWWVTLRKDIFDIPLAIVGCFLPRLWEMVKAGGEGEEGGS
jgi:hypothetical protein